MDDQKYRKWKCTAKFQHYFTFKNWQGLPGEIGELAG